MARRGYRSGKALTQWERQYRHLPPSQRTAVAGDDGYMRSSASVTTLLFAGALITQSSGVSNAAGPLPVPQANFATSGVATVTSLGANMAINQASQRAILNWQSFNIDAGNSVRFNQPNATAVALNRIFDANPSVIRGQLSANGQIYLINRNGILFDKGSQVNVNTLIASTLDINDNLFNNGILSAAAFGPVFQQNPGDPANVAVIVEAGARIQTDAGGRVMLFAPSVVNRGDIRTPDGQTVLAAGNKIYLRNSEDANLRGFLVEVDSAQISPPAPAILVPDRTKAAVNEGTITAERGNISLVGLAVRQSGTLTATTSTGANGSIVLNARDGAKLSDPGDIRSVTTTRAGTVNLTSGSLTQVTVDAGDKAGIDANVNFNPSSIDVSGHKIVHEGSIVAPAGKVTFTAQANPSAGTLNELAKSPDDSRIYLANNSNIDVSGTTSTVLPMSRNLLTVELRGDELKDVPEQRNGVLRGQKVVIDVNKGTTVADVTKQIAAVPKGIGEVSADGGAVTMVSQGDIVMQQGAAIDVSGGRVSYESGVLNTTKLVSQGRVYDIGTASPDRQYDAILSAGDYSVRTNKWGITQTFDIGRSLQTVAPGYVTGASAGSVNLTAHAMALDGSFIGKAFAGGPYQRESGKLPSAGLLAINDFENAGNFRKLDEKTTLQTHSHDAVLQAGVPTLTAPVTPGDTLSKDQPLMLSTDFLTQGGFGRFSLKRNGSVEVPKGVDIGVPVGGSVSLTGRALNVDANISAPGGSISLQTINVPLPQDLPVKPPEPPSALTVGPDSSLSTRGQWVNDLPSVAGASSGIGPVLINGGNLAINAFADLRLGKVVNGRVLPTVLDVSGGGWISASGAFKAGNGGNLSIGAISGSNGLVQLGAAIRGVAPGSGGTLTLSGGDVTVRNGVPNATAEGLVLAAGDVVQSGTSLTLPSWMFSTLGFTKYDVRASRSFTVAADTALALAAPYLATLPDARFRPTGSDVATFTQLEALPELRKPVSLTVAPPEGSRVPMTITVAPGARVYTDPGATIGLTTNASMVVGGALEAPAGVINLNLSPLNGGNFDPAQSIWLGPQSLLSAAGTVKLTPDPLGRRLGTVLDGGSVNITAGRGYVVTETGSKMNVSGTQADLDMPALNGARVRVPVASNAGVVKITAAEGMLLDGDINGRAGGPRAAGGLLSLTLTVQNRRDTAPQEESTFPSGNRVISLRSGDIATVPAGLKPGEVVQRAKDNDLNGFALLNVNKIEAGGFAQFTAKSDQDMQFAGNVTLRLDRSLTLDAPRIDVAKGEALLKSAFVALGSSDAAFQSAPLPATGTGSLSVSADLIELVGQTTVTGARTMILASTGDIRARGVFANNRIGGGFTTAGKLELNAAQVYPTTFSQFDIRSGGDLLIGPKVADSVTPLSAGGLLKLSAPNITVAGTLRAPLGSLELNAADTLTLSGTSVLSVSSGGKQIPFGLTQNGLDWVYTPQNGTNLVIDQPPEKVVKLGATNVKLLPGATVDVSGGGDLYAYEFVPGPGGSKDALANVVDAKTNQMYAVLPGLNSAYAPYDQQYYVDSALKPGDSVYLSGGGGLAAGTYALLPARYALLPGAFLVTPAANATSIVPGQNSAQLDGTPLVAGYRTAAGTVTTDNRWTPFAIQPGSAARALAEYRDSTANTFFTARAQAAGNQTPPLPVDAGRLALGATQALTLAGARLLTEHEPGSRGTNVDISADRLAITAPDATDTSGLAGYVQLRASDLTALNAQSLLLGGTRTSTADGTDVRVTAKDVVIANSASNPLRLPEVIIAASDSVTARAGSVIQGVGSSKTSNISIGYKYDPAVPVTDSAQVARRDINADGKVDAADNIDGRGALLRVAGGTQAQISRDNVIDRAKGTLQITSNASVNGDGSLILDATSDTRVLGQARLGAGTLGRDTNGDGVIDARDNRIGGAVNLAAGLISAGDTAGANGGSGIASGLVLSNNILDQLRGVNTLTLRSYSTLDLYGGTQLGAIDPSTGKPFLSLLEINSAGIGGYNNAGTQSNITAGTIRFNNAGGGVAAGAPNAAGNLFIAADRVILGSGDKTINGYGSVAISAPSEIRLEGAGTVKVAAPLTLDTSRVTADVAASQTISAQRDNASASPTYFPVRVTNSSKSPSALDAADSVAARLTLTGAGILQNGVISMPGGSVTLNAKGSAGDVALGAGSVIDTRGVSRAIAGVPVNAPAGNVTLVSDQGNVVIDTGARVDVSATASDAGRVTIGAVNGVAAIRGEVRGAAGTALSGLRQGGFTLNARYINADTTATANDFSPLNTRLNTGGFTNERSIRLRNGDITIGASDAVTANTVSLVADGGKIDLSGRIDASGLNGGSVFLAGRDDVTLRDGSVLLAKATAEGGSGGKVTASIANGQVFFSGQSLIDVSKYRYQASDVNVAAAGTAVTPGGSATAFTADFASAPQALVVGMNVVFMATDNSRGPGTLSVNRLPSVAIKRNDGTDIAADDIRAGDIVKLTYDGTYFRLPQGDKGTVVFRGPRNAAGNDMALTAQGTVVGARSVVAEGVKIYTANTLSNGVDSATNLSTSVTGKANLEAGNFVDAANFNSRGVRRRLSASVSDAFELRPGVEVQSTADLTISGTAWNLLPWRYSGEPGVLTLRAPGNIAINTSISDGFSNAATTGTLQDTLSWSYRFTSGADLSSANPYAVLPIAGTGALAANTGNLSVAAGTLVRTGTGSIDINSGRDFVLGKAASGPNLSTAAVYTAGRPSEVFATSGANGFPTINLTTASYPTGGGDLTISAQQDIEGAVSKQLISEWLVRRGQTNATTGAIVANRNTGWGVNFAKFQQNTGALGGGDVSVNAGGSIRNLSIMLPTSGRLIGATGTQPDPNNLVVTGGGDLTVNAAKDIGSGVFYVGRGIGTIHAGDSILAARTVFDSDPNAPVANLPINTILALGDGRIDVRAGRNVAIETVLNPTAVTQDKSVIGTFPGNPANRTYFYTYSPVAAVKLEALSGDVILNNNQDALKFSTPDATFNGANSNDVEALVVYPGRLDVYAGRGDIRVANSFTLFPSGQGNLQLIAGAHVKVDGRVNLADADPALLLNPLRLPLTGNFVGYSNTAASLSPTPTSATTARLLHALTPVHENDSENLVRIVAAEGSILGGDFYFAKPSQLYAGTDVRDIRFLGQNLHAGDVTSIVAGRDVAFATPRLSTGAQDINLGRVVLGGPGRLEVEAGRNLDLGNSQGVITRGNIINPALPPGGASVTLSAGISTAPAYGEFIAKYFDAVAQERVVQYVRAQTGDASLSGEAALSAFNGLPRSTQLVAPFMVDIRSKFYNELTQAGREATQVGGNYQRGFNAIKALFSGTLYRGDLSLLFSQIKTEAGGSIDLLVPGGRVNAGQTTPPSQSGSTKAADQLGVLVFENGAVHAFSRGDFAVNESRVFTLQGGDILIWSSEGDIDAGRGAKTAVSAPAPILVTDAFGNTSFKFNSVSGSGIRSILTRSDIVPGNVDLIAPSGVVNAGDAGIGAAGNINIAALRVVGADNIQVGGKSTGVPLGDTGAAGRGLSLSNVSNDATRTVDQATRTLGSGTANESLRSGFISVEVLSIGNQP
jgi:filamentous hemagglutinin